MYGDGSDVVADGFSGREEASEDGSLGERGAGPEGCGERGGEGRGDRVTVANERSDSATDDRRRGACWCEFSWMCQLGEEGARGGEGS